MRPNNNHPLTQKHYRRIGTRNESQVGRMAPLWSLAFLTRGKSLVPLGGTSLQVMSEHAGNNGLVIEVTCVTGDIQHSKCDVNFGCIRMSHDFAKPPFPRASGRVLDPRETGDASAKPHEKPNAGWVRWAFDSFRAREIALSRSQQLPAVPDLPRIMVGFASMELVPFTMTTALHQVLAGHLGRSAESLPTDGSLQPVAESLWPELFLAPGDAHNNTGLYLIDHAFITDASQATRIYEDYSQMRGTDSWNPARDIPETGFINPLWGMANKAEVIGLVDELMTTAADDPAVEEKNAKLQGILAEMKDSLGESGALFDEGDLLDAIASKKEDLVYPHVGKVLEKLGEAGTVRLLRNVLGLRRPHLLPYVTDSDLLAAAHAPAAPLYISKLPQIQVMRRDLRVPLSEALRFSPSLLGRERLSASLWVGNWAPGAEYNHQFQVPATSRRNKRKKTHGAAVTSEPAAASPIGV